MFPVEAATQTSDSLRSNVLLYNLSRLVVQAQVRLIRVYCRIATRVSFDHVAGGLSISYR